MISSLNTQGGRRYPQMRSSCSGMVSRLFSVSGVVPSTVLTQRHLFIVAAESRAFNISAEPRVYEVEVS